MILPFASIEAVVPMVCVPMAVGSRAATPFLTGHDSRKIDPDAGTP